MAGIGPGLLDLASLTAGDWEAEKRDAIVSAYCTALTSVATAAIPATFATDLDYCRFQLAIQWLGWSETWSPPVEHAHDWLDEALRLGEQIQQ